MENEVDYSMSKSPWLTENQYSQIWLSAKVKVNIFMMIFYMPFIPVRLEEGKLKSRWVSFMDEYLVDYVLSNLLTKWGLISYPLATNIENWFC